MVRLWPNDGLFRCANHKAAPCGGGLWMPGEEREHAPRTAPAARLVGIGKIPLGRACAILVREASKFLPQYAATLPFMGRLAIDFH